MRGKVAGSGTVYLTTECWLRVRRLAKVRPPKASYPVGVPLVRADHSAWRWALPDYGRMCER
jgi:hypothetical protein